MAVASEPVIEFFYAGRGRGRYIRWEQACSCQAVRLESAPITTKCNPDVIRGFYEHRPVCGEKLHLLEDFASS